MIQLADCLKRKGKKIPQKHQNVPQSIGKNKKGKIIQLTSKVKVSWECYTMWKKNHPLRFDVYQGNMYFMYLYFVDV